MIEQGTQRSGRWIAPAWAGAVLGPALQLQQAALWEAAGYAVVFVTGLLLLAGAMRRRAALHRAAVLLALACISFAATGLRASNAADDALAPGLEGRDLVITGVVSAMPHRSEAGLRFRFRVESARSGASVVALPRQLSLGWYGGVFGDGAQADLQRQSPDLRAGERWRLGVRLKAPHGHVNPHGFDYELWLWELLVVHSQGPASKP